MLTILKPRRAGSSSERGLLIWIVQFLQKATPCRPEKRLQILEGFPGAQVWTALSMWTASGRSAAIVLADFPKAMA